MTDPHSREPATGKVALVTGAGSGIGRATALGLARRGYRVVVAGRSLERSRAALDEISAAGDAAKAGPALFLPLDLGDLGSVRACADAFLALGLPLHLLIANAGLGAARGKTASGFEIAFGTNHMGHFALTTALLPALRRAAPARVVVVASDSHAFARRWSWEPLRQGTGSPFGLLEYARSKLANICFAAELARRHGAEGITAFSVHPGVIASEVWRHLPPLLARLNRLRLSPPEQGAAAVLQAALHARPSDTGAYFNKLRLARPSRLARDAELARAIWDRSAQWLDEAGFSHPAGPPE